MENNSKTKEGDLILFDVGAQKIGIMEILQGHFQ